MQTILCVSHLRIRQAVIELHPVDRRAGRDQSEPVDSSAESSHQILPPPSTRVLQSPVFEGSFSRGRFSSPS